MERLPDAVLWDRSASTASFTTAGFQRFKHQTADGFDTPNQRTFFYDNRDNGANRRTIGKRKPKKEIFGTNILSALDATTTVVVPPIAAVVVVNVNSNEYAFCR